MKILVIPDTHIPFHDKDAWNLTLKVVKQAKPDQAVIIGDFSDYLAVSSFPKPPARKNLLKKEVQATNREQYRLQEAIGGRPVTFLEGNHEYRLKKFLAEKAPALHGLVDNEDLFRIKELGWKWVPYMQHHVIGKVLFAHDLGHCGKHAALNTLAAAGMCTVFGHTHRGGVHYGGTVDGDHRFALNVGWLGDPNKIDYMHRAKTRDWMQGFGWINMDSKGLAWAQFCPIVAGSVCVDGRWYR